MSYSSKLYAQSFCAIVLKETTSPGIEKCIRNFLALIEKNRDQRKFPEIILLSEKIIREKIGGRSLLIETARPTTIEGADIINSFIRKTDSIKRKVSPGMMAGIKITINDELQLDESFSKKIKNILKIKCPTK